MERVAKLRNHPHIVLSFNYGSQPDFNYVTITDERSKLFISLTPDEWGALAEQARYIRALARPVL